jgi:hypothetical protein
MNTYPQIYMDIKMAKFQHMYFSVQMKLNDVEDAYTIVHCATNHQFKMFLDVIITWSGITLSVCA